MGLGVAAAAVERAPVPAGSPATPEPASPEPASPEPPSPEPAEAEALRLEVDRTSLPARTRTRWAFRLRDAAGDVVRLDAPPLLVLADRDLSRVALLHPRPDGAGGWTHDLTADPGRYRVLVQAEVPGTGDRTAVLGADLAVAGPDDGRPLPPPAASVPLDDGLVVTLGRDGGTVRPEVTRDGAPVLLGEPGVLLALRADDLTLVAGSARDDGSYGLDLTPGTWRVLLELRVDGVTRQATFTVPA